MCTERRHTATAQPSTGPRLSCASLGLLAPVLLVAEAVGVRDLVK
jgi:hypothetical protein